MSKFTAAHRRKFGKMVRLRQCLFALTCIRGFIGHVAADSTNGVEFLYPTEGLTLHYMDIVNVTYTSGFSSPQMWVFCSNASDVTASLITGKCRELEADFNLLCTEEKTTALPYNASKLMQIDWVGGSPCWFDLKPDSTGGKGRNSPQFASASTTSTPATASKSSGGLSTGAKAAIGIAVALGCVIILALAAFFYWRRRRAQSTENHMLVPHTEQDLKAPEVYTPDYKSPPVYTHTTHEMYAPVTELPASSDYVHHELPGRG
ncbi:transmembrane alpha-helix domain-containing protein [Rutstroemia sp. NJR-2017a BVV2]|nr:transmembrane alpha-helix domain-containing protein [Rutstroemia sp. NJR-2017a BVV2]